MTIRTKLEHLEGDRYVNMNGALNVLLGIAIGASGSELTVQAMAFYLSELEEGYGIGGHQAADLVAGVLAHIVEDAGHFAVFNMPIPPAKE
jgi:hypothetical protein